MTQWFKSKKILAVAVSVVIVAAGVIGWRLYAKTGPTFHELAAMRGDIDVVVSATGVVQPSNRLEIKPPIAGRVEEVLVREGQFLRKGQVMAWMSSSERAALIDAARAKGPDELKRWEELYRPTPVIAPIDGTVILRNAEPGQTFQSQDAEFVMSDRLIVRAQVDETDIAQVKLRQRASMTLDAYPNESLAGAVKDIAFDSKTVNNVTTYEVDVLPDKAPPFMRSGMTANVSFVIASRHDIVIVPAEAVRTREGQSRVLLAAKDAGDKPFERQIQVGLSDGRRTEVLSGLDVGDRVLVPQLLKTGKSSGSSPLTPFGGSRR